MKYQITNQISNTTEEEMWASLEWLKDNLSTKIINASGDSETLLIDSVVEEALFVDMVSTIQDLKTQFVDRLVKYRFTYLP